MNVCCISNQERGQRVDGGSRVPHFTKKIGRKVRQKQNKTKTKTKHKKTQNKTNKQAKSNNKNRKKNVKIVKKNKVRKRFQSCFLIAPFSKCNQFDVVYTKTLFQFIKNRISCMYYKIHCAF